MSSGQSFNELGCSVAAAANTTTQRNVSTKKRRQRSVRRSVARAVDFILQRLYYIHRGPWRRGPALCWLINSLNRILWTYQLSSDSSPRCFVQVCTCRPADWYGRVMDICESGFACKGVQCICIAPESISLLSGALQTCMQVNCLLLITLYYCRTLQTCMQVNCLQLITLYYCRTFLERPST